MIKTQKERENGITNQGDGKQFATPLGGLGIPFIIRVNHALSADNFGMSEMMEVVYRSQFLTKSIILGTIKNK